MPDRSAAIHMSSIADELLDPGPATPGRSTNSVRRLLLVVAASAVLLLPVAAFASETALPGDVLYPVKVAFERVRVVFDARVESRHRIEEAEIMVNREVDADLVRERLRIAEDGLGDSDLDLQRRIDTLQLQLKSALETGSSTEPDPHRDRDQDQGGTLEPGAESNQPSTQTPNATAPGGSNNSDSSGGDGSDAGSGDGNREGSGSGATDPLRESGDSRSSP